MVYTYIDTSWEKEKEEGRLSSAIETIRLQIATNLMKVHNLFSDKKLESPEDVYVFVLYEDVFENEIEKFKPFLDFGDTLRELEYSDELDFSDLETLEDYEKLEVSVKEAMKNI